MHDGAHVMLKKLDPLKHDPTDRLAAIQLLEEARRDNLFITGLIYFDKDRQSLLETSHIIDEPLVHLPDERLRPPREALDAVMSRLTCCE